MARPRSFDEHQVLSAAGDLFWAKGYDATSTRDLVSVTGLSQPSLYNAFGDKRGLFLRALDHYLDHSLRERISRLESTQPPASAITAFFAEIIGRSLSDRQHRGCLLVNSTLQSTPEDPELRQAITTELDVIRQFFLRCLTAARQQDALSLPPGVDIDDAASQLLAMTLGLRVIARVAPRAGLLVAAVRPALTSFGLPALDFPPEFPERR